MLLENHESEWQRRQSQESREQWLYSLGGGMPWTLVHLSVRATLAVCVCQWCLSVRPCMQKRAVIVFFRGWCAALWRSMSSSLKSYQNQYQNRAYCQVFYVNEEFILMLWCYKGQLHISLSKHVFIPSCPAAECSVRFKFSSADQTGGKSCTYIHLLTLAYKASAYALLKVLPRTNLCQRLVK